MRIFLSSPWREREKGEQGRRRAGEKERRGEGEKFRRRKGEKKRRRDGVTERRGEGEKSPIPDLATTQHFFFQLQKF